MAAIARVPDAFDAAVPMAGIYDFADAYLIAAAEHSGVGAVASFDKGIDRAGTIQRLVPPQ